MGFLIFLIMAGVPLIEIALFIEIGGHIGIPLTLLTCFLTALIGGILLRVQGLGTYARAQASLARGEAPVADVFHGVLLMLAGSLLLTPGFFTDAVGFLLFVPPLRTAMGRWLFRQLLKRGNIHVRTSGGMGGRPGGGPRDRVVDLDADEFHETDARNGDGKDGAGDPRSLNRPSKRSGGREN